jgi:hypothetical protein
MSWAARAGSPACSPLWAPWLSIPLLAWFGSFGFGCKKAPPPAPVAAPAPIVSVDVRDDERTCTKSAECVLITVDCCDCSSYGWQTGVRADRVAAVIERRAPVCTPSPCALGESQHDSCAARRATCRKGVCEPETFDEARDRLQPVEPEDDDEVEDPADTADPADPADPADERREIGPIEPLEVIRPGDTRAR